MLLSLLQEVFDQVEQLVIRVDLHDVEQFLSQDNLGVLGAVVVCVASEEVRPDTSPPDAFFALLR